LRLCWRFALCASVQLWSKGWQRPLSWSAHVLVNTCVRAAERADTVGIYMRVMNSTDNDTSDRLRLTPQILYLGGIYHLPLLHLLNTGRHATFYLSEGQAS
jgi:hypothetical protein